MSAEVRPLVERLREALGEHQGTAGQFCRACRWIPDDLDRDDRENQLDHLADVAAQVVAEYVTDRERAAEVRALRQWRLAAILRDRADHIEGGE